MSIRYTLAAIALALAVQPEARPDTDAREQTHADGTQQVDAEKMMPFARLLNELSQRRRRVVYTDNPTSLFDGAPAGLVRLGAGSLSLKRRDLVTQGLMPIAAARVYDSRRGARGDFGVGGWRLSLAVSLTVTGGEATLVTADGAFVRLRERGDRFEPLRSQPSPLRAVTRVAGGRIEVRWRDGHRWLLAPGREAGRFLLREQVDAFGNTLEYGWDAHDRLAQVSGAHARLTIGRDATGLVTRVASDDGRHVAYAYDAANYLTAVTDPGGNVWRYAYDASGRLSRATGPDGAPDLAVGYDGAGRVAELSRHGFTRQFEYGLRSPTFAGLSVTRVSEPGRVARLFGHNADGVTVMADNGLGPPALLELDERNRPRLLVAGERRVFEFAYGVNGRLARLTRAGQDGGDTLLYQYAEDGELVAIRDAAGVALAEAAREPTGEFVVRQGEDEFRYRLDASGLLRRAAFGAGLSYAFLHDARGRITRVLDSRARRVSMVYDAAGRLAQVVFPGGETHAYAYDELGLRTATDVSTGANARYSYAPDGRIERYTLSAPAGDTTTTHHRFDKHGRVAAIDSAGVSYEIAYRAGDRPAHIETEDGRLAFFYDDGGRFAAVSDGNLTWRYRYAEFEEGLVARAESRHFPDPYDTSSDAVPGAGVYAVHYLRRRPAYLGPLDLDAGLGVFSLTHDLGVALPGDRERHMLQATGIVHASGSALATDDRTGARIAFNAPSSLLFVPPEYWSLNCIICLGQQPLAITPSRPADSWPALEVLVHTIEPICYLHPGDSPGPGCTLEVSGLPGYMCVGNQATIGATLLPDYLDDIRINWTSNDFLALLPPGARGAQVDVQATSPAGPPVSGTGSVAASYDRIFASCADAGTVPVIANKLTAYADVVDIDRCPERQQDTGRAYDIDGCSIPPVLSFLTFSGDVQDPIGGDHHAPGQPTTFGSNQGQLAYGQTPANLPCNKHDVCYQTCGHNRLGCDNDFLDDMGRVCGLAYPDDCPFGFATPSCGFFEIEKIECGLGRIAMFQAVRLAGSPAYRERQVQHCQCCPAD